MKRFLVIGLGSIGQRHLRNLRSLMPGAKLGVLRRPSSPPAAEGADYVFHDLPSALAFRPTAAIVASPATEHLAVVRILIDEDIPVLVEKPFADQLEGLPALVETARKKSVPLFVAYNLRFHPILQRIKTTLTESAIGRVLTVRAEVGQYLPDWRPNQPYRESVSALRELGGGALLELSHELDYVSWLLGRPERLFAAGGQLGDLGIDVEDMVLLTLRYGAAAPIVTVHLDFLQRAVTRQLRVVGTQGTLAADLITGELGIFLASTGAWSHETCTPTDGNQLYLHELEAFVSAITGRQPTELASGREGMDVICMVEAARQSMAERREVEIEYV